MHKKNLSHLDQQKLRYSISRKCSLKEFEQGQLDGHFTDQRPNDSIKSE